MGHNIEEFAFSDNWIQFFQSDGGGEYMLTKFQQYLSDHGIVHETTAADTAESNGLAECMNQTIAHQAVSMLIDSKLPKSFWVEAFRMATYLITHSPAAGLKGKMLYKTLTGQHVDPTFFHPFGCIVYSFIVKSHQKKLDPKAWKAILLGYEYGKKAYCFLNVATWKIFSSRHVIFNKNGKIPDDLAESTQFQWEDLFHDLPYQPEDPMPDTQLLAPQPASQALRNSTISDKDEITDENTISVGDIQGSPNALRGEPEMQISHVEPSFCSP